MVQFVFDDQLWRFVMIGAHFQVVFLAWDVVLSVTPVDHLQSLLSVVDHNILGFEVPVHDPILMSVLQRLQGLITIQLDIPDCELRLQNNEWSVFHVLEDEAVHP